MWHVGSLVQLVQLVSFDSLLQLVSFDCLIACFSLCYVFVAYLLFAIFGPQYSLSSSKYLPLDVCIAFHYLVEKYTIYGGTQFILPFYAFRPFWQSMPMGEKFQRVLWRSLQSFLLALVLFLSICISYACIFGCCIAWMMHNSLY